MTRIFRLAIAVFCAFQFAPALSKAATDAVVTHGATLRSDPSSQHTPILVLQAGDDVEVLDPTPTHKYYHVRTSDGTEGWVYSRSLEIISTPNVTGNASPVAERCAQGP